MNNLKTVVVIADDIALRSVITRVLEKSYKIIGFTNIQSSLDYIYNSIPDLLIISADINNALTTRLLTDLKTDPIFGQLPVLSISADSDMIRRWSRFLIDDFVHAQSVEQDLHLRVDLSILRSERVFEVNPLTRLPGNIAIMKQIQLRLDRGDIFGLAYADLDFFKPFNDRYGFSRGDEVIKMFGRLALNLVKAKQPQESFVGHIGGDDFVFIMDIDSVSETAADIIDNFDKIIPTFYDPDDRSKKGIESVDREGIKKTFPLISVSIGIVSNQNRVFKHYGEMTEIASDMKKYAKLHTGSCFRIDKRESS